PSLTCLLRVFSTSGQITSMIPSAHRTASAIAATVAGTFLLRIALRKLPGGRETRRNRQKRSGGSRIRVYCIFAVCSSTLFSYCEVETPLYDPFPDGYSKIA